MGGAADEALQAEEQFESVDALIVGAGFSGLGAARACQQAGLHDLLIMDMAGGIGGAWYNNNYPGLACDVPSQSINSLSGPILIGPGFLLPVLRSSDICTRLRKRWVSSTSSGLTLKCWMPSGGRTFSNGAFRPIEGRYGDDRSPGPLSRGDDTNDEVQRAIERRRPPRD